DWKPVKVMPALEVTPEQLERLAVRRRRLEQEEQHRRERRAIRLAKAEWNRMLNRCKTAKARMDFDFHSLLAVVANAQCLQISRECYAAHLRKLRQAGEPLPNKE